MMHTYPTLLLSLFLVSMGLMLLACYCGLQINRVARKFLEYLYDIDRDAYKKMLGRRESSWIERRTDSITDFSLWWRLYRTIYRDGEGGYEVNTKMQRQFVVYVHLMIASFVTSLLIACLVLVTGFMLAAP